MFVLREFDFNAFVRVGLKNVVPSEKEDSLGWDCVKSSDNSWVYKIVIEDGV